MAVVGVELETLVSEPELMALLEAMYNTLK